MNRSLACILYHVLIVTIFGLVRDNLKSFTLDGNMIPEFNIIE